MLLKYFVCEEFGSSCAMSVIQTILQIISSLHLSTVLDRKKISKNLSKILDKLSPENDNLNTEQSSF